MAQRDLGIPNFNRAMTTQADKVPPRALPLLYLGTAHVALALACLFAAIWPRAVAGFFYHAWLIGLVHMVTLGWISFSILGAIYIVGPLALRMDLRPRGLDYVAYACGLVGLIGMVGHLWIQEYAGMAWSAGTIAAGMFYMTARIADLPAHRPSISGSSTPSERPSRCAWPRR
jgi:hypothetical protein